MTFDLDLGSCRGDDELKTCLALVKCAVFGSKMIVNDVSVTSVFALLHITMCAEHVWQLLCYGL